MPGASGAASEGEEADMTDMASMLSAQTPRINACFMLSCISSRTVSCVLTVSLTTLPTTAASGVGCPLRSQQITLRPHPN